MKKPQYPNYEHRKRGLFPKDWVYDQRLYIDQLEAENKKLKEASSILNTIGKDTPCPVCNNKLTYKPRLYYCNHCGSDFN